MTMVCKNDLKFLRGCTESLPNGVRLEIGDDTGGSINDTAKLICDNYRDEAKFIRIERFKNFSDKRNHMLYMIEAASQSSLNWLLYLDADERLVHGEYLPQLVAEIPDNVNCALIEWVNPNAVISTGETIVSTHKLPRLFRLGKGFRFRYSVHEDITPSIYEYHQSRGEEAKYVLIDSKDAYIAHLGNDISQSEMRAKTIVRLGQIQDEIRLNGLTANMAWHRANAFGALGQHLAATNDYHLCSQSADMKDKGVECLRRELWHRKKSEEL